MSVEYANVDSDHYNAQKAFDALTENFRAYRYHAKIPRE